MKLVIVESPAKAKTIEKFLGKDYKVESSYGHIRDLPSSAAEIPKDYRDKEWSRLGVDPDNGFQPIYIVPKESKKRLTELKKKIKEADEILLATDEDREGEAISWHLLEELKPQAPVKRIAFHEITKPAIEEALKNPRDINTQLVRAQESRRILDRLYGYTLSPVLWKKVRTKLSAGRVQSVAVRLIVEREEERQRFKSTEFWDVEATLASRDKEFTASLLSIGKKRLATSKDFDNITGELKNAEKVDVLNQERAEAIARQSFDAAPWRVARVEQKESKRRPSPPFTTSTLQQAASSKLNMPPNRTMQIAQRLYEGVELGGGDREGLITYMRTDSFTLSQKALDDSAAFIKKQFGDSYYEGTRIYKTKSKSAQEAHEAIRPTEIFRTPDSVAPYLNKNELALYTLIWNRTVASQMADARLDKTTVDIEANADGQTYLFRANGSVVRFPGFLRVYGEEQKDTLLPDLKEGQAIGTAQQPKEVNLLKTIPQKHVTTPPSRYTEASLVKKLEEEGIGRPSTYAPTITIIQQRDYVAKKNNALIPTYVGMAVVNLLRQHFPHYVDYQFTAKMEDELDEIADGKADSVEFLREFYHGESNGNGLLNDINKEMPNIGFPSIPLGKDPETGEEVFIRVGRNAVYVQRGDGGEGNSAAIPLDLLIDELDLDKALDIVKTRAKANEPIGLDEETGKNIYVLVGPYGPYIQVGENDGEKKPRRVSLPKGTDITQVDINYAKRLLQLPRDLGQDPETGKKVTAGLGIYGPYVHSGGKYKSIESVDRLFTITLEEAIEKLKTANQKTVLKEVGEHPESGKALQVLKGRYGPYVTDGKVNASIPKGSEPEDMTLEEAVKMLEEAASRKKSPRRKSSTKKSTAKKKTATKKSPTKKKSTAKKSTAKKKTGAKKTTAPSSPEQS